MFRSLSKSMIHITAGFMFVCACCGLVAEQADQSAPRAMFDAADAGELDVRVIPKNANQATILLTNKTDQPISVQLPEAT